MSELEILVDARGHRCPIPTLRLRRACQLAPSGATLRVLADDPMARIDIPHFARAAGLDLLHIDVEGPVISVLLKVPRKGGAARRWGGTTRRQDDFCLVLIDAADARDGKARRRSTLSFYEHAPEPGMNGV